MVKLVTVRCRPKVVGNDLGVRIKLWDLLLMKWRAGSNLNDQSGGNYYCLKYKDLHYISLV